MKSQMGESTQLSEEKPDESEPLAVEQKFSLYVRGAAWIKDRDNAANRLKEIEPRIQDVRHPRQKSADYCFIDFACAADREQSYEKLKSHPEVEVKRVTKDVPRLLEKRQQKIAEKRAAKRETKKLIREIKKKEKAKAKQAEKTNQIVILNVPKQVTRADLKQQYPNAIKIILREANKKKGKRSPAIITFANTRDAYAASQEESINLHGIKINVRLNTNKEFKRNAKSKAAKRKPASQDGSQQPPSKCPKTEKSENEE